jgi:hypothetical protein
MHGKRSSALGEALPASDELEAVAELSAGLVRACERVQMSVAAVRRHDESGESGRVELSPELAWRLTRFARDVRIDARTLGAWGAHVAGVGFANSGGLVFMDESAEEIPTL